MAGGFTVKVRNGRDAKHYLLLKAMAQRQRSRIVGRVLVFINSDRREFWCIPSINLCRGEMTRGFMVGWFYWAIQVAWPLTDQLTLKEGVEVE